MHQQTLVLVLGVVAGARLWVAAWADSGWRTAMWAQTGYAGWSGQVRLVGEAGMT
jgi:hypothetical protein